jgi:hypothetical protein
MSEQIDKEHENLGSIEAYETAIRYCDVFISQLAAYETPQINRELDALYNQIPIEEQLAIAPDEKDLDRLAQKTILTIAKIENINPNYLSEEDLYRLSDIGDLVFSAALVDAAEDLRHLDPEIDQLESPFSPKMIISLLKLSRKQIIPAKQLIIRRR